MSVPFFSEKDVIKKNRIQTSNLFTFNNSNNIFTPIFSFSENITNSSAIENAILAIIIENNLN